MFLQSLASGHGSFVKTVSVVPDGFEVGVDSEFRRLRFSSDADIVHLTNARIIIRLVVYGMIGST